MDILRTIILLVLTFFATLSNAQKDIAIPVNQRIILNYADFTVYANILATENNIKVSDNLYYYWFSANDIKRTRGGYDGKLLHGVYTEFYLNKNLKEKGQFRYGLKNKEWKSWYINGEYKEICDWSKGKRKGNCRLFNEDGKLSEERSYRDDLLHGKCINYTKGSDPEILKYKNGELVKSKVRKRIFIRKKYKGAKKEANKEAQDTLIEKMKKDDPKPEPAVKEPKKTEGKKIKDPSKEEKPNEKKAKKTD